MRILITLFFLLLFKIASFAQTNPIYKTVRFLNVMDSTTVPQVNGTMYYNTQSTPTGFRFYENGAWKKLGTSGGGGFTLTDGQGTTANGTAVDLGGSITQFTHVNAPAGDEIRIESAAASSGSAVTLNGAAGSAELSAEDIINLGTFDGSNSSSLVLTPSALNLTSAVLQINSTAGTSGQVLTSNGAASAPTWQTPSGGGGVTTASNGLSISGSDVRLGGSNVTTATTIPITSGSLMVTGTDKPFTLRSTSGFQPKLRIEGDQSNSDGRNYELEPQLVSGFIEGIAFKYSTAHNTSASEISWFQRADNGDFKIGATGDFAQNFTFQKSDGSFYAGNQIEYTNAYDFNQGFTVNNTGTGGHNILKGQNYSMKGSSIGNFINADSPDNGANSMADMSYNFVSGIGSTVSVRNISGSLMFGDDYDVNQATNEFTGLYNIMMGNHNVMNNTHHLFQFGTGLVNSYNNTDHGLWKFQPKFYFGNNNVDMGTVKASFVIANGYVGVYRSNSFTHLTSGWTQINTTNSTGFEGGAGGPDDDLSIAEVTPLAALEVVSTTSGILFPRLTTTQRNAIASPVNGTVIYNSTTDKLQVRAAGAWVDLH
jgi:hypothetical protein